MPSTRPAPVRAVVAAASPDGVKASVAGNFVGAAAFVAVDVEDGEVSGVRSVRSPFPDGHQSGQIPRWVHDELDADVIITGEIGSHAFDAFHSYNMEVVKGVGGSVAEVVKAWIDGHPKQCDPVMCSSCSKDCSSRQ